MQEEKYEVHVKPKNKSNLSGIIFIVILIGFFIAIPIYLLTYEPVRSANADQAKEVDRYRLAAPDAHISEKKRIIQEDTDILAKTVYGLNNELIGTLYNVYADADTGEIYWFSINENNNPNNGLRLVAGGDIVNLKEDEPVKINMARTSFLELPLQTNMLSQLNGLLSLRHLPGSTIYDPSRRNIGNVTRVDYFNGKLDRIFFSTAGQEFYVPFVALDFKALGYSYMNDYAIELSERQAGGVQMYLQNSQQF